MRTDCTIRTTGEIRLPRIPLVGAGRPSHVKRGDFIQWRIGTIVCWGRIIGFVTAHDLKSEHIVVAMFHNGAVWERWADPADVDDAWTQDTQSTFHRKTKWLFSPEFLDTPVDIARQSYDLTVEQMGVAKFRDEMTEEELIKRGIVPTVVL